MADTPITAALYLYFDPGSEDGRTGPKDSKYREGFADPMWRGRICPLLVVDGGDDFPTGAKTGDRPAWVLGRDAEVCDFPLNPKNNPRLGYISGLHCTIYYDHSARSWYLLNGGSYPDSKKGKRGGYAPSLNGVWLNGKRQDASPNEEGRYVPDPTPIKPQDMLWLGPGCKILIVGSLTPTVVPEVWESDGWQRLAPPPAKVDPKLEAALQEQSERAKAANHQTLKMQMLSMMDTATWPERFFYGALLLGTVAVTVGVPLLINAVVNLMSGE